MTELGVCLSDLQRLPRPIMCFRLFVRSPTLGVELLRIPYILSYVFLYKRRRAMFEKTFPLLAIFLLGFGLKKLKVIRKEDGRMLSTLLMTIVVPATIINSISTVVIEPQFVLLPLAGITVELTLLGIGFLLAPLLRLGEGAKGAFLISFPTMECGSIGYVVMSVVFGAGGLTSIVLFDLGNALCIFLLIPILASFLGQRKDTFRLSTVAEKSCCF